MKMRTTTLILMAAVAVSTLAAQPGPHPRGPREGGPKLDEIKSYLGLSEEQVQQFQAQRQSFRESMRTVMDDTRTKRQQLREEMERESPSPGIVGDLTVQIQQARKQIGEKQKEFSAQARNILTEEQQAKLAALEAARSLLPAIRQAQGLQLLEDDDPDGPGPGFGPGPPFRAPRPEARDSGRGFRRGGSRL